MRNSLILCILFVLAVSSVALAGDLYQITIRSRADAQSVNSLKVQPVQRLADGYLVITAAATAAVISKKNILCELVATGVAIEQLATGRSGLAPKTGQYEPIYQRGDFCLYKLGPDVRVLPQGPDRLTPVDNRFLRIEYKDPLKLNPAAIANADQLDLVVDAVSQDSVEAAMSRLQAFLGRYAGDDSCAAAEAWIKSKFESYGYDSVYFDSFPCNVFPAIQGYYGRNVVAVKVGTRFPDRQVVVGAHHDAVADCPGIDDNGSGTIGVLETARVLAPVATEMTVVFVTFTAEEQGLQGSRHYAQQAALNGDSILLMQNLDMIGHYQNDTQASLQCEPQLAYGELWQYFADSAAGIAALFDLNSASDHTSFQNVGYDILAVQEKIFSTHYHMPSDSTPYINMDYLTRMIKVTAATTYTVAASLPPTPITSVQNVGNGQSVRVNWQTTGFAAIDHFRLYYSTVGASGVDSILISGDSTRFVVDGLTENQEYRFYLVATDTYGTSSIASAVVVCIPSHLPALPAQQLALPIHDGIKLYWKSSTTELDFDHYGIYRDGQMYLNPYYDSVLYDTDPALGSGFHSYLVVAFDADGYMCDTVGAKTVSMKAAALAEQRILALNRTSSDGGYHLVNPALTAQFMTSALHGLDYDYAVDTLRRKSTDLLDLTDYGLVVIAQEGARSDELADYWSRFLDTLGYYLSIGGKAIVFGRWGDVDFTPDEIFVDTMYYPVGYYAHAYTGQFNIAYRVRPLSHVTGPWEVISDFVGAHSQKPAYPDLAWDSAATSSHCPAPFWTVTGIPCPSYPVFVDDQQVDVIYSFHSSTNSDLTEGKPIAWRYLDDSLKYIHFEMPLSFMQGAAARAALRQAAQELGIILPVECCVGIRGNANGDPLDKVNISDVTYLMDYMFGTPSGPQPACREEGNANGDPYDKVNVSDLTYLLGYMFGIPIGPPPPACP